MQWPRLCVLDLKVRPCLMTGICMTWYRSTRAPYSILGTNSTTFLSCITQHRVGTKFSESFFSTTRLLSRMECRFDYPGLKACVGLARMGDMHVWTYNMRRILRYQFLSSGTNWERGACPRIPRRSRREFPATRTAVQVPF